jgi:hypothetical protein
MDQFDEHRPPHDRVGRKMFGNHGTLPCLPGPFELFDPVLDLHALPSAQAGEMVHSSRHGWRTPKVAVGERVRFHRRLRVLFVRQLLIACADV